MSQSNSPEDRIFYQLIEISNNISEVIPLVMMLEGIDKQQ